MTTAPLRVGIIGSGIGRSHAEGYATQSRVTIAAIAGLDERSKTLAASYGARHYGEYAELLAQPDIDAVSVCAQWFACRSDLGGLGGRQTCTG